MHPDLPTEQAYFDRALALRDRQQAGLALAPGMAANPRAAAELRKRVSRLGLDDPDQAIAFGRIEAAERRWYIGKGAIWDDDNELVVVNWQAPIAAPFYTATPDEPEGLDARRLYRCTGNQIREIEEVMFHEVARAISEGRSPEPVLTDALLESLGSARSGELGDIVATIQASQYDVISRPIDGLLVVQGGPGTGKTVVALHRVSWLLYNRRDRLEPRDVLIVGPNPAFVRYIGAVLPSLGEEAVVQLPLRALGPRVRIGRVDPPALRRLKGDRRMLRLILRGLRNRQRVDAAAPVEVTVAGRRLQLDSRRIATRARQLAGRPHNEAHRAMRVFVTAEARAALARVGAGDVEITAANAADIDSYLDRVWPRLTPQSFLVGLLSSRRQLLAAGAGTLSDAELGQLALPSDARVSTWQWSVDDVPLLDAADALLNGVTASYEHIVVDEVQDLSPLQLESIRRRSRTGSMTVLGDLAQGTGPWAHDAWAPIVQALRHERVTVGTAELEHGYRLPAEVHEVAMRLLPYVAPGLSRPRAVRSSGHSVTVTRVEDSDRDPLAERTVAVIDELVGEGIVGVIVPPSARADLVAALDAAGVAWTGELRPSAAAVVVLTPDEAKGLEFDAVVVVEPAAIVDEADQGLRALFVSLTRCTTRLALVHARPLPALLGLGVPPAEEHDAESMPTEPTAAAEPTTAADDEPAPDAAQARVALARAFDDMEHEVARAIATTVADKLNTVVAPALLPLVADELARVIRARAGVGHDPADAGAADADADADPAADQTAEAPPEGIAAPTGDPDAVGAAAGSADDPPTLGSVGDLDDLDDAADSDAAADPDPADVPDDLDDVGASDAAGDPDAADDAATAEDSDDPGTADTTADLTG